MLRTIVGSRVKLVEDVDCQPCFVEADPSQFETALVNMAVNARDAMDGQGTLAIAVRTVPKLPALNGHAGKPGPIWSWRSLTLGRDRPRAAEPKF